MSPPRSTTSPSPSGRGTMSRRKWRCCGGAGRLLQCGICIPARSVCTTPSESIRRTLTRSYVSKPHRLLARFKKSEYVDLSCYDLSEDEGELIIQLLFGKNALRLERNQLVPDGGRYFDPPLEEPQDLVTERLNLAGNEQLGNLFAERVITALLRRQGRDGLSEEAYEAMTRSLHVPKNDKHLTAPPFVLKQMDLRGTSVDKKYSDIIAAMLQRDNSNKFELQAEETQRIKLPRVFSGQPPARAFRSRDTYD
mmetsp:Transcript_81378/g.217641  ORF Transcript_81378/g.217641 Transcript_81378/m.217641 type:complete len:252 (-) Transcript_81378:210-965(-)